MFKCIKLVLEKGDVKLAVTVRTNLDELRDQEGSVSIFVLTHAVLITTEKFDDGLEEVRANVAYRVS